MSFATDYRRLVLPLLAAEAQYRGRRAVFLDLSFSDALADVWAMATRRGANYLPDAYCWELRDWLMSRVGEGMDEAHRLIESL